MQILGLGAIFLDASASLTGLFGYVSDQSHAWIKQIVIEADFLKLFCPKTCFFQWPSKAPEIPIHLSPRSRVNALPSTEWFHLSLQNSPGLSLLVEHLSQNLASRAARVAQRFSAAFSPGHDPGDPGSSPTSGSLHGACFSLCLCLCFSVSLISVFRGQQQTCRVVVMAEARRGRPSVVLSGNPEAAKHIWAGSQILRQLVSLSGVIDRASRDTLHRTSRPVVCQPCQAE